MSGDRGLDLDMLMRERDWLIQLLTDPGRVDITHRGFDVGRGGVIAYEVPYGRFEISIRLKARI